MTSAFIVVAVFVLGAVSGSLLLSWVAWYLSRDTTFLASLVSRLLAASAQRCGHVHLSTIDDEQRLVFIPIDRLCQSIETQVTLWWQSPPAVPPPPHIHFDPPEGSS